MQPYLRVSMYQEDSWFFQRTSTFGFSMTLGTCVPTITIINTLDESVDTKLSHHSKNADSTPSCINIGWNDGWVTCAVFIPNSIQIANIRVTRNLPVLTMMRLRDPPQSRHTKTTQVHVLYLKILYSLHVEIRDTKFISVTTFPDRCISQWARRSWGMQQIRVPRTDPELSGSGEILMISVMVWLRLAEQKKTRKYQTTSDRVRSKKNTSRNLSQHKQYIFGGGQSWYLPFAIKYVIALRCRATIALRCRATIGPAKLPVEWGAKNTLHAKAHRKSA